MSDTSKTVHRRRLRTLATAIQTRDEKIREAYSAGLTKMEIHRLTGLSRMTIDAALEKENAQ